MVVVTSANLHTSLGALLIGGLTATTLSGVVCMQTILYYRMFKNDHAALKIIVATIFILDLIHTGTVWVADWQYIVAGFGNLNITDHVFWPAGVTIALTAMTTLVVHLFYTYRLWRLSKQNYFITAPMVLLALCRCTSALATSSLLISLGSFFDFYTHYRWLFTLGLALSTAIDIMITSSLCLLLRRSRRRGSGRLDQVLDSMTLYTVENGMMTCVMTATSLIFWLSKPHALIYLGMHFAISKLYANSYLASMNARKLLRGRNAGSGNSDQLPVMFFMSRRNRRSLPDTLDITGTEVRITIDKTVDYINDDEPSDIPLAESMSPVDRIEDVKA